MGNLLELVNDTTNTPFVLYGEIGVTSATKPFKIHFAPHSFSKDPRLQSVQPQIRNLVWDLGYLHIWDSYTLIWGCPRHLDRVVIAASHLLTERKGGILSLSAKSALYLLPDRDFSNAS